MFEKEAEEYAGQSCFTEMPNPSLSESIDISDDIKEAVMFGYNKGKAETVLLSQHILDLQKDKGNLTDKVRELEQQIEKMKCPWNCKKFGDCKLSICPCDKWELRR